VSHVGVTTWRQKTHSAVRTALLARGTGDRHRRQMPMHAGRR
jgi:hypothetical protein